jgi:hypothetical protein
MRNAAALGALAPTGDMRFDLIGRYYSALLDP